MCVCVCVCVFKKMFLSIPIDMALDASLLGVLFRLMSFRGFELEAAFAHYGRLGVWSQPINTGHIPYNGLSCLRMEAFLPC